MRLLILLDRVACELRERREHLIPPRIFDIRRLDRLNLAAHVRAVRPKVRRRRQHARFHQLFIRLHAGREHPHKRKQKHPRRQKQQRMSPSAAREVFREAGFAHVAATPASPLAWRRKGHGDVAATGFLKYGHNEPTSSTATTAPASAPARSGKGSTPSPTRSPCGNTGTRFGTGRRRKRVWSCSA